MGSVACRRQHRKRSDVVRPPDFVNELQKAREDPDKGIRSLAREMNVGAAPMKHALNDDIRYHSYQRHRGHLLTATAQNDRLKKAKQLLNKLKHAVEPWTLWFFSGEKYF